MTADGRENGRTPPAGGVKVAEVLDAARRGRAMLAPEIAGYLVLAAADQLARAPALLDEHRCGLLVEGGRVVLAPSPPSSALESERTLRDLLRRLLEAASGRAPALSAVANGAAKGNVAVLVAELEVANGAAKGNVAVLVAELESALIPVNRSAAGRALSRLARDAVRARASGEPVEEAAGDTERIQVAEGAADVAEAIEDHELLDEPVERPEEPGAPPSQKPGIGTSDIDDLLSARLSSTPPPVGPAMPVALPMPSAPPPIAAPPTPAPPAAPVATAPVEASPTADTPAIQPSDAPLRPSYPSASMRGVDDLIQDFMQTTSRKEARVAQDLRKMTGVEVPPPTPDPSPITLGAHHPYDSPFENASGAADFYTATPPLRGMVAQSVAPAAEDDPLAGRSTRRKVYVMLGLVSLLTLGTVTLLRLEPGVLSGRTADVVEAEKRAAAAAAASIAARSAAGPCRATLVVSDVPQGAEVLVRSGVAPVDVDRVPSGARLEFVALVDGYAPRKANPVSSFRFSSRKAARSRARSIRGPAPNRAAWWEARAGPARCTWSRARAARKCGWLLAARPRPRSRRFLAAPASSSWSPERRKRSRSVAACASTRPSLHPKLRPMRSPAASAPGEKREQRTLDIGEPTCTNKTRRS